MSERGPVIPEGREAMYDRFHFAPAYRVGDTIYVSGVIGFGQDGRVPDTAAAEFKNAFDQLAATLVACGSSVNDIVEMTSFHVDMSETLRDFIAAKDAVIAEPYPAWTAIGCTELFMRGARAEVKATAVIS
jgi:enamine deaminase RidA (YjgF/YER057c/UK114 family)